MKVMAGENSKDAEGAGEEAEEERDCEEQRRGRISADNQAMDVSRRWISETKLPNGSPNFLGFGNNKRICAMFEIQWERMQRVERERQKQVVVRKVVQKAKEKMEKLLMGLAPFMYICKRFLHQLSFHFVFRKARPM
nr:hypothetical protein [Tanacetum cinerariifolium]